MFYSIFNLWFGLPVLLRVCLSLGLIAISVFTFFAGRVWIWPGAIGAVLLMFVNAGGNPKGYNF